MLDRRVHVKILQLRLLVRVVRDERRVVHVAPWVQADAKEL
jgi:hypothetical protein